MNRPLITASADLIGLQTRLIEQARRLADSRIATSVQPDRTGKWRKAALLWPLFGQE